MLNLNEVRFPNAYRELFSPHRYKVIWGGRAGGKSWQMARALLIIGASKKMRILCAREIQHSIADSVHKLLCDQINDLQLDKFYRITQNAITGINGTEFIFKGLHFNAKEIKSTEGINIAWVEEAQAVSAESWDILIPTIREEKSEIWVSFNPDREEDSTYQRFIVNPPDDAYVRKVNFDENPHFPDVLKAEAEYLKKVDPNAYAHVWLGECRVISDAIIFKDRWSVEEFETPPDARFYFGADWGFASDPTTLVRCWIKDKCLYIDYEAYGVGVELDETAQLFDSVPGSRRWPIYADSARPETISYMRKQGFNISAAEKWQGSIEDGIAYLRAFEHIYVHPRCKHMADELRHYSYKVDKTTQEVLPVIVDANNHLVDSLRYSCFKMIKGRMPMNINPALLRRRRF